MLWIWTTIRRCCRGECNQICLRWPCNIWGSCIILNKGSVPLCAAKLSQFPWYPFLWQWHKYLQGATGHLLGAAGSVEAMFTVLAIHHVCYLISSFSLENSPVHNVIYRFQGVAPPTLNLEQPDPLFEGAFMPLTASKRMPIRAAISNSFGFGGTNTSLLFSCPP